MKDITEGYTKDQIEENIDYFLENQKEQDNDDKEMLSTCCGYSALQKYIIITKLKKLRQ